MNLLQLAASVMFVHEHLLYRVPTATNLEIVYVLVTSELNVRYSDRITRD